MVVNSRVLSIKINLIYCTFGLFEKCNDFLIADMQNRTCMDHPVKTFFLFAI